MFTNTHVNLNVQKYSIFWLVVLKSLISKDDLSFR